MSEASDPGRRKGAGRLPFVVGARNGGICVAASLAAVGILFAWQSSLLDLGHIGLPGAGFFPLVLAITVIALSVAIGIELWHAGGSDKVGLFHRDLLIVMAASLAVPLLFEALGALLTLGLFAVAILVLVARVSPLLAAVAASVFVAACWVMF